MIYNSVVEDSQPFQGLDNHTHHVSVEGFSGSRINYGKTPHQNYQAQNAIFQYGNNQLPNVREKGKNNTQFCLVMNEREKEDSSIYFNERIASDMNEKSASFGHFINGSSSQNDLKQQLSSRNNASFKIKNQIQNAATQNRKMSNIDNFDNNTKQVFQAQK